jgi:hypothetical protein
VGKTSSANENKKIEEGDIKTQGEKNRGSNLLLLVHEIRLCHASPPAD